MLTVEPTLAARQQAVAALMRRSPGGRLSRAVVEELAAQLGVSPATIRRDQKALQGGAVPGQVAAPPRPARPEVYVLPQPASAPPPPPRQPARSSQAPAGDEPFPEPPPLEDLSELPLQEALARLARVTHSWSYNPRGDWALKGVQLTAALLTQRHQLIEQTKLGDEELDEEEIEKRIIETLGQLPPRVRRLVGLG